VKQALLEYVNDDETVLARHLSKAQVQASIEAQLKRTKKCCGGIIRDLKTRIPFYPSDWKDGFTDKRSVSKTIATSVFLYFACMIPSIAFGVLNSANTNGTIDVQKRTQDCAP